MPEAQVRTGRKAHVLAPLAIDVELLGLGVATVVHPREGHRCDHHVARAQLDTGELDIVADQADAVGHREPAHRFLDEIGDRFRLGAKPVLDLGMAGEEVEGEGQRVGDSVEPGNEQQEADRQEFVHGQLATVNLVVGETAKQVVARLRTHIEAQPEVAQVYSLITQQLGSDIMLAVKARMRPTPSDIALIEAINAVEARVRAEFEQVRWIFFEPDVID